MRLWRVHYLYVGAYRGQWVPEGSLCSCGLAVGVAFDGEAREAFRVLSGSGVGEGPVAMLLGAGGSGGHSWGGERSFV